MLTPLPGRLLVEKVPAPDMHGRIHLPAAREPEDVEAGVVVAVAPEETNVRVGDTVLFSREYGQGVTYGGRKLLGLRRNDLLGKLVS